MNTHPELYIFGILGLGRVGTVLARRLVRAGLSVAAAWDTAESARERFVSAGVPGISVDPVVLSRCNAVFLCVPDDRIADGLSHALTREWIRPGTVVIHTSGVHGPGIFHTADRARIQPAVCHPLMAFPPEPADAMPFDNVAFSIDGDPPVRHLLEITVERLGGFAVHIPESARATYHAAAVVASNFTVYLEKVAADLLRRAGISDDQVPVMLESLMRSVLYNVSGRSPGDVLSGPAVRGDRNTIRRHRDALEHVAPEWLLLYDALTAAIQADIRGNRALSTATESATVSEVFDSEVHNDEKSNGSSHKNNTGHGD